MRNQIVTLLVGPPCCGKSTYLANLEYDQVISSDAIVLSLCKRENLAYPDFFKLPTHHPIRQQHDKIFTARLEQSKREENIVWDLTNLTVSNRARVMENYEHASFHAVVFEFRGYETLLHERNEHRYTQTGKYVDPVVLEQMFAQFEPVSSTEGFSSVILQPVK